CCLFFSMFSQFYTAPRYRPNKNLEIKKFGRGVSDDFCSIKKRTSQFKMLFIAQSLRYIKVPVGASKSVRDTIL
ncbi:hypothetical protein, partial [Psychrobacter celer]|uniref:hypothetical protein n=1 Tax=Psychrobacter celer TaxID=306572 RepID=UPI003FD4BCE0